MNVIRRSMTRMFRVSSLFALLPVLSQPLVMRPINNNLSDLITTIPNQHPSLLTQAYSSMAWRSSGSTNDELVTNLYEKGVIKSPKVVAAMKAVDRGHYCGPYTTYAYMDAPMSIGSNATISAPHMHAYALDLLSDKLVPGAAALDVGSGSGYLLTCMGAMVAPEIASPELKKDNNDSLVGSVTDTTSTNNDIKHHGIAVGVDHIARLVESANANIAKDPVGRRLLEAKVIKNIVADGRTHVHPEGPFDAIHVGAASPTTPMTLANQLKVGGKMIVPVGPEGGEQTLYMITRKSETEFSTRELMGVIYVPLTSANHQLRRE